MEVKFSIRKYEDVALSSMEVCHMLLVRPYIFNKKSMHNDHTNEVTFTHKERKFVLHPLIPFQVEDKQVKMRNKRGKEKDKEKKKHISHILVRLNVQSVKVTHISPMNALTKEYSC